VCAWVRSESKGALYHCDYCRTDISQLVRIKCAECEDFDLCVRCFASGMHVAPHKPDHAYRVVDFVRTPLWAPDWGADEELLLLEALELYGMGNWSDVADHVGSKNKQQCEQHYADVYCTTKDLMPDPSKALTRKSKAEADAAMADAAASEAQVKQEADSKRAATPSTNNKPLAKGAVNKPKPKTGLGPLVGYIPNRGGQHSHTSAPSKLARFGLRCQRSFSLAVSLFLFCFSLVALQTSTPSTRTTPS
jgi:transcriptional adapter 2-alpha